MNGLSQNGKLVRSSNFELLRIVCMLMIICGHIIMVHECEVIGSFSWYIKQLLSPYCVVAVNVFVLISGYFGINLKYKKLWGLNWMTTFYSTLFLIVMVWSGLHDIDLKKDWMYLFPVITKRYWFITVYFALCFVSPALNKLVEILNETLFRKILISCFCLFVILPTIGFVLNFPSITGDAGYGLINFMFLYLLGRYIRLYYNVSVKKYYYLFGYFCAMAICGVFLVIYSNLLGFTFDALMSYDTVFVFIGALCLFLYFKEMNICSNTINKLAVPCLAVYILHLHPLFFDYFVKNILPVNDFQGLKYLLLLFCAPFVVYLVCAIIELCRLRIILLFRGSFR